MKRCVLIIVLLFATAFPAFAQVEEEIQQSKAERIAKGRAYLLEKFLDRDYDKVKEAKDYLLTLEDDNYAVFVPAEYWHVLLWTKEFDELTSNMRAFDSTQFVAYKNKVKPQRDQLSEQVSRRSVEDEHLLRFNLQEAQLPVEDFDFLSLFLDWDLKPYTAENQKEWNEKSDKFLEEFPNSDYEWFVRHLIRVKIDEDGSGWGMGFGACSALATGKFQRPIIGLCWDVDFFIKKFDLCFSFNALYSHTKVDQAYGSYGNVYEKGKECDYLSLDACLAYPVYEGKTVKVSPFLGAGWMQEYYAWAKNPQIKDLTKNLGVGHIGAFFDFPLKDRTFIRLKYDFGMTSIDHVFSQMHRVSVGWNMAIRKEKRVY